MDWQTVQDAITGEVESKLMARTEALTDTFYTGILKFHAGIQDYVADQAEARASLVALLDNLSAFVTSEAKLPTPAEAAAQMQTSDTDLITANLETDVEETVGDSLNGTISDTIPYNAP